MSPVLVVDSSYLPHRVVDWQTAMSLLFGGKVEVVETYADQEIRTVSMSFPMPAVVRLLGKTKQRKRSLKFSRVNVMTRDGFQCQYCGKKDVMRNLTFDHVVPRSKGGKTTWDNIVTACVPCNAAKGNRTPEQAGMTLRRRPKRPEWLPVTAVRFDLAGMSFPDVWRNYMYWMGGLEEDR